MEKDARFISQEIIDQGKNIKSIHFTDKNELIKKLEDIVTKKQSFYLKLQEE